jgi:hypothetical protein
LGCTCNDHDPQKTKKGIDKLILLRYNILTWPGQAAVGWDSFTRVNADAPEGEPISTIRFWCSPESKPRPGMALDDSTALPTGANDSVPRGAEAWQGRRAGTGDPREGVLLRPRSSAPALTCLDVQAVSFLFGRQTSAPAASPRKNRDVLSTWKKKVPFY